MATHEVVINFKYSGKTALLFQGSAGYHSSLLQTDKVKITHKNIIIEAVRSRVAKDPLRSQDSSFYKQMLKSLCLYYILCRQANNIKGITVNVQKANGVMVCIAELGDGMRQIIGKSCNLSVLSKIKPQKAEIVMHKTTVGKSVLYAATHLIKSLDAQCSVERFLRLWRAFNALYRVLARQSADHECHRVVRQHIMNNIMHFPHSLASISAFTSEEIRQNTRWVKMILNSCPHQNKANALADSLLRNKDARILEVYRQTLPARKNFLSSAGRMNEVVSHISSNIAMNSVCDQDVLATISLRYAYFIRNKIAHAEKVDHGFSFLHEDRDRAEAKWLAPILESLVIDMINISDTF